MSRETDPYQSKIGPLNAKNYPLKTGTAAPSIISLWSKIDVDSPEKDDFPGIRPQGIRFSWSWSALSLPWGVKREVKMSPDFWDRDPLFTPPPLPRGNMGSFGTMKFGFLGVNSLFNLAVPHFVLPKPTEKKTWYGWSGTPCITKYKNIFIGGEGWGRGENIDNYSPQHEYKALVVKQPLPRPHGMERRRADLPPARNRERAEKSL